MTDHYDEDRSLVHAPPVAIVTETAATAVAAASKATILARYELAQLRPRNIDDVRTRLLKECDRPGFAKEARYRKPVGNKKNDAGEWVPEFVEGLSVRFAEAALRYMGNLYTGAVVVFDDVAKSIVRVTVMDLETNATIETDVVIAKTVERKSLRKGQVPLAQRTNSYGDRVFIVEATDDQIANKLNAAVSKALRNGVCRLVPGDILDECEERCIRVAAKKDAEDPDRARKELFAAFSKLGVMPSEIEMWLGHPTDVLAPKELADLRGIYSAIRDGDTSWQEIREAQIAEESGGKQTEASKRVDELVEKHKAKAAAKKDKKSEAKPEAKPASQPKTEKPADPEDDGREPSNGEVSADQEPPQ